MPADRQGSETGASLVEAAFAIPIFFLLVFGLIDFGLQALESNQAANAARDGARAGVINYRYLDAAGRTSDPKPAGSKDYDLLKAAVERNLPGRDIPDADLDVRCLTPAGTDTPCLTARVDVDRVQVEVRWDRDSVSPIAALLGFSTMTAEGEARMTIVGAPVAGAGGPAPVACSVSSLSVPTPVTLSLSGGLESDLTFSSASTGACSNAQIRVTSPSPGSITTTICSSGCVGSYTHDKDELTPVWTPGDWTAAIVSSTGDLLRSATFTVESAVVPCSVSGIEPSPTSVVRRATHHLAADLTVTVSGSGDCTDLVVLLRSPSGSTHTLCTGASCIGSHTYLAETTAMWTTPGTGRVEVSGDDAAAVDFTVNDTETCEIAGVAQYDPVVAKKNMELTPIAPPSKMRQRVTVGTSGPCANVRVRLKAPDASLTSDLALEGGSYEYSTADRFWTAGTGTVQVTANGAADFVDLDTFVVDD